MTRKQSVEQLIYNTLKTAILSRKLAPGNQLVETAISNQLNVSRTPIRNAIRKLSGEGLVNNIPNKGAFVVNPTRDEIIQAYNLRKELEIIAVKDAITFLTESDFERMEQSIKNEDIALENKCLVDYLDSNKEFHMVIAERSENKYLLEFIEKLINQTNIYLILFDSFFEELSTTPKSPIGHALIISLLKKKDLPSLKETLSAHYEFAIESLALNEREYQNVDDLF